MNNNLDQEEIKAKELSITTPMSFSESLQYLQKQLDTYFESNKNASFYDAMSDLWTNNTPIPTDKEKYIKQLKKQVKHAENPMEIKKLNQEIMELQFELNKSKKVKYVSK